jgi:hypothetical protein
MDEAIEHSRTRPLWVLPDSNSRNESKARAVVRHTQEDRLRTAFKRALQIHGYDKHGRRIVKSPLKPSSPASSSSSPPPSGDAAPANPQRTLSSDTDPEQLYGMVRLSCVAIEVSTFPWDKIVAQLVELVKHLKVMLGCRVGEKPEPEKSRQSRPQSQQRDSRAHEKGPGISKHTSHRRVNTSPELKSSVGKENSAPWNSKNASSQDPGGRFKNGAKKNRRDADP